MTVANIKTKVTGKNESTRRSRKKKPVDQSLLQAMEALLASGENFSSVSVERLAETAGIARATFYLHFRDKAELVTHLVAQIRTDIITSAGRWFEDASFTTRDDMKRTLRGIISTYREHHVVLSALAQTALVDNDLAAQHEELRQALCSASRTAIAQLRQSGQAHPAADDLVADLLTLAIDHCSTQDFAMLQGSRFNDVVEAWTHICWNALSQENNVG